jgi:hypothetical protein
MGKRVISFRLSDETLQDLDLASKRFGMNRSEVVSKGIAVLLAEYLKEGDALVRRAPWINESTDGGKNDGVS